MYLREVIGDYLSKRTIMYTTERGSLARRKINRGVPQRSILGPLLWNLGFNSLLEVAVPNGVRIICYADDTLLVACEGGGKGGIDTHPQTHGSGDCSQKSLRNCSQAWR